jgi:hypothetical protein
MFYAMGASVNCLAEGMRVIRRIAKEAILQDLCPKGMGASVKENIIKERNATH